MSLPFWLALALATSPARASDVPHVRVAATCELLITGDHVPDYPLTFNHDFTLSSRDAQAATFDPHFTPDKSVFVFSLTPNPRSIPGDIQVYTLSITRLRNDERSVRAFDPRTAEVVVAPDALDLEQLSGTLSRWITVMVHPEGRLSISMIENGRMVNDDAGRVEVTMPYEMVEGGPAERGLRERLKRSLKKPIAEKRSSFQLKITFEASPDLVSTP